MQATRMVSAVYFSCMMRAMATTLFFISSMQSAMLAVASSMKQTSILHSKGGEGGVQPLLKESEAAVNDEWISKSVANK